MTAPDLAAIQARADAATTPEGQWVLAANAREDVPALLARVRELEADRDGWKQAARVYAKSRDASDHRADKARADLARVRAVLDDPATVEAVAEALLLAHGKHGDHVSAYTVTAMTAVRVVAERIGGAT